MIHSFEFTDEYGYIKDNKNTKDLIGKKFTFSDKINIIFGDNGSGKSSILRAIAANALTNDGWTKPFLFEPVYLTNFKNILYGDDDKDERYTIEDLKEKIVTNEAKNSYKIEWDGIPVYYENFQSKNGSSIGDFSGSLLDGAGDEVVYHFGKNKVSKGELQFFLFNKLYKQIEKPVTLDMVCEKVKKWAKNSNDVWYSCYKIQEEYLYSQLKENIDNPKNTVLLDEIDKSFSITNAILFYKDILPRLCEKTNTQIILVSHNPIVLSNIIYDRKDVYNLVSINEEYTTEIKEMLKDIKF